MRLLRAELAKLRRPLTWWVAVAAVVASLALAWQGTRNASAAARPNLTAPRTPTCSDFALPPGPLCERAVVVQEQINAYHEQQAAGRSSTRHNGHPTDALPVEQPLSAGKLALGFMASLGGALLIFLLAAGHVGNEWDQRTIKVLLSQDGTRWKVLVAKATSIWIAAMAILFADWAVLAASSAVFKAAYPLSTPGLSWGQAWTAIAADAARVPLVIAVFAILGTAAAVIMRNTLAAFALAGGVILASLVAAGNLVSIAPWTIAYWVSGWMQFRSHGYVIYHFWVDGYPTAVHPPGALTGFLGLAATVTVVAVAATALFRRSDITS